MPGFNSVFDFIFDDTFFSDGMIITLLLPYSKYPIGH